MDTRSSRIWRPDSAGSIRRARARSIPACRSWRTRAWSRARTKAARPPIASRRPDWPKSVPATAKSKTWRPTWTSRSVGSPIRFEPPSRVDRRICGPSSRRRPERLEPRRAPRAPPRQTSRMEQTGAIDRAAQIDRAPQIDQAPQIDRAAGIGQTVEIDQTVGIDRSVAIVGSQHTRGAARMTPGSTTRPGDPRATTRVRGSRMPRRTWKPGQKKPGPSNRGPTDGATTHRGRVVSGASAWALRSVVSSSGADRRAPGPTVPAVIGGPRQGRRQARQQGRSGRIWSGRHTRSATRPDARGASMGSPRTRLPNWWRSWRMPPVGSARCCVGPPEGEPPLVLAQAWLSPRSIRGRAPRHRWRRRSPRPRRR